MTSELIEFLRRRTAIIADHAWRDRDAAEHLGALKQVSEEISAWTIAHRTSKGTGYLRKPEKPRSSAKKPKNQGFRTAKNRRGRSEKKPPGTGDWTRS